MHDIKFIRENTSKFDHALNRRGLESLSKILLSLDDGRRKAITQAENAQAKANQVTKAAETAKMQGNKQEFEDLRRSISEQKTAIATLEATAKKAAAKLQSKLMEIPNILLDSVPNGTDENDNIEIKKWGELPKFTFTPKEHHDIKAVQGWMDFEAASRLSGARFVVMSGAIARIHRALGQFMLDTHINENGLVEINAPILVHEQTMRGTGQLPKFAEDSYQTTEGKWLIPTSEVSLTNLMNNKIIPESELPKRFSAHSLCFRSEAGSAGRDTAGMLRQHQFEKVEMVSITHPSASDNELERMTHIAEDILERLNLPYRTVILCAGDIGFSAMRTNDIEVWLPGQNKYREISSCSVCGDFQARRMGAKFRPTKNTKPEFVHTLNGSGLAVGRCLIAVLENGQREDGGVNLPEILAPYLNGKTFLDKNGNLQEKSSSCD